MIGRILIEAHEPLPGYIPSQNNDKWRPHVWAVVNLSTSYRTFTKQIKFIATFAVILC